MVRLNDDFGTVIENNCALLMARIIDRDGGALRPADVAAIEFDVFAEHRDPPVRCQTADGPDGVALNICDVMFDAMQMGDWSVDAVGYNFRHALNIEQAGLDRSCRSFDIAYRFTLKCGEWMTVWFQIGRRSL